jgi:TolB protein
MAGAPEHVTIDRLETLRHYRAAIAFAGAIMFLGAQTAPEPPRAAPPTELVLVIRGDAGAPPHYAVPDFTALTSDKETQNAARLIAEVVFADLSFEREYDLIPRDTYQTIDPSSTGGAIPFDRWRELGADGVVTGTVRKIGNTFQVEMRLYNVRARGVALGRVYDNVSLRNPRAAAHAISDEIHETQSGLRGVARTRLAFISDRDNEQIADRFEPAKVKEVYVADYDGANQIRLTSNRRLNVTPAWSPDARSIAYASYTLIHPQILVSHIYRGTREALTDEVTSAYSPAFSPDGSRVAFVSHRDGDSEIYVMNRDGSHVRRLTNNNAIDSTPTWSPTGTQIAFTSGRSGSAQIWVMDADGLNVRRISYGESSADKATWSPAPFNEIAYAGQSGSGYDIKIYDVATGDIRTVTDGAGSNESPVFSPNGRHLAFMSTRAGGTHIFTIARDGHNLRQVTLRGRNTYPDWSR